MTEKQKLFCEEYLIDLNATQAALRAGYSEKTAYSIGNENLKKPEIQEYIQKRLKEKEDALIAKQDEVLKTLTAVMRREKPETVKHVNHTMTTMARKSLTRRSNRYVLKYRQRCRT